MKKLYICHTYYHVMIAAIKSIKKAATDSCDIMLSHSWKTDILIKDSNLKKRLETSGIFQKVIIGDFMNSECLNINYRRLKNLKKYIFLKKYIKNSPYDLDNYDEIYLFSGNTPTGRLIEKKKLYYNLLEDGTDCFKNNKNIIKGKMSLKKLIKYALGLKDLGESKYAKTVEVNDKNGIFLKHKKIIEQPKKELFKSLSLQEKDIICKIFLNNIDLRKFDGYSLIITQPLYEDEILTSEQEQLDIYDKIISQYCGKERKLIKTHPREKIEYYKLKNKCEILNENFPLELFDFYDEILFKNIVTISSTSINIFRHYEKKIELGWDWLYENKK